jgi:membrane-associated phospholipid phosphatase
MNILINYMNILIKAFGLTIISILIIMFFDKITKLSFYKKINDEEYLQLYQPIYAKYKKEVFPKYTDMVIQPFLLSLLLVNEYKIQIIKYLIGLILNQFIIIISKRLFKHPRPFTLSELIIPDTNNDNNVQINKLIQKRNDNKDISYYFRSFPSGRAALSIYCLLFAFYLNNKLIIILNLIFTFIINCTIIISNRHHPKDLYFGFFIGYTTFNLTNHLFSYL